MNDQKNIDDGIIKFNLSNHPISGEIPVREYQVLETYRDKLYKFGLIGEYKDYNVGFGNISKKMDYSWIYNSPSSQFLISGSQTGCLKKLTGKHYVRVLHYNLSKQFIKSSGPISPSSESLTHAAIYEASNHIGAIMHIHNKKIWQSMLQSNFLKTAKDIPYGTLEMANEVKRVINNSQEGIIVMHGHEDGVVAFGENLRRCEEIIFDIFKKFHP